MASYDALSKRVFLLCLAYAPYCSASPPITSAPTISPTPVPGPDEPVLNAASVLLVASIWVCVYLILICNWVTRPAGRKQLRRKLGQKKEEEERSDYHVRRRTIEIKEEKAAQKRQRATSRGMRKLSQRKSSPNLGHHVGFADQTAEEEQPKISVHVDSVEPEPEPEKKKKRESRQKKSSVVKKQLSGVIEEEDRLSLQEDASSPTKKKEKEDKEKEDEQDKEKDDTGATSEVVATVAEESEEEEFTENPFRKATLDGAMGSSFRKKIIEEEESNV